jgi:hypothetical protein
MMEQEVDGNKDGSSHVLLAAGKKNGGFLN